MSNAYFLRAAYNEMRKARGEEEIDPISFADLMDEKMKLVEMDPDMLAVGEHRVLGGREEAEQILQMAVLEPKLAVLDETDSGSTSTRCGSWRTA